MTSPVPILPLIGLIRGFPENQGYKAKSGKSLQSVMAIKHSKKQIPLYTKNQKMNPEFIKNILLPKRLNPRIAMRKKHSPIKKKEKTQTVRAEGSAIRTLRTLNNEEAFHFYEALNVPTGQKARNLNEFLDGIKCAKLESLIFHLERKDFKKWIENTVGDRELARKIEMIPTTHDEQLRKRMQTTVMTRLKELEKTITFYVEQPMSVPA